MKGSRFKEEQIIALLREQEAGAATADVCRKPAISRDSEFGSSFFSRQERWIV